MFSDTWDMKVMTSTFGSLVLHDLQGLGSLTNTWLHFSDTMKIRLRYHLLISRSYLWVEIPCRSYR
jgi:hypothetical protein